MASICFIFGADDVAVQVAVQVIIAKDTVEWEFDVIVPVICENANRVVC